MKYLLLLLLLAGCKQPEYRDYTIKVVSPSGETHKVIKFQHNFKPTVYSDWNGCHYTYIGHKVVNNIYRVPVGWMLEVE